jgi:predicted dehydrogenase
VSHRWGIIGPGAIALQFADDMTLVDDGEVVAVASRSAERADAFGDRFGIRRRYDRSEALVADTDVDVVYVATPHSRHAADCIEALEAGKHVLCEKPFALNAVEARRVADVARTNGLFLMEAMWSRFLPAYRTLAALLADEAIGRPLLVEADFGFRVPFDPTHRLFDRSLGGGALIDLGIYPVQLCSLVLGRPSAVVAEGTIGQSGVDEQVAAILRYPGGGLGVVKAAIRTGLSCTARISGTRGWIDVPAWMHCAHSLTVTTRSGAETIDCGYDGEGLRYEVQEVHRCIDEGLTESPTMPLGETLSIAETLDSIRAQIGLVYPGEVSA